MISSVRHQPANASYAPQTRAPGRASFKGSRVEANVQRSATLEVTTQDGDKVSISFSAAQQFQTERAKARDGASRSQSHTTSGSSSVSVDVKVEGDLSDQEVAEISKLLSALTSAARGSGAPSYQRTGSKPTPVQPSAVPAAPPPPPPPQPVAALPVDAPQDSEQAVAQQPALQQPVAQQPVTEQPVAEQPISLPPAPPAPPAYSSIGRFQFSYSQQTEYTRTALRFYGK